MSWLRHWNLIRDPFPPGGGPFVATATHSEAVARVVHAVEAGERLTTIRAGAGLGKTVVLGRALARIKAPGVRLARAEGPVDGLDLCDQVARSIRLVAGPAKAPAWRPLIDAARLIRAQGGTLVVGVDDADRLDDPRDLDRLARLDPSIRVVATIRPDVDRADAFPVSLARLDRTEASAYLTIKLGLAGRDAPTFTTRGFAVLHAIAEGSPAAIDRLAGLCLRASSLGEARPIEPGLIEAVASELAA